MRMLSRWPYNSFESALNKLVISTLFEGADVLHSSQPDAAQRTTQKGAIYEVSRHALWEPYRCPRNTVFAVETKPSALNNMHWPIIIARPVCHRILACFGGQISWIICNYSKNLSQRLARNTYPSVVTHLVYRSAILTSFDKWLFSAKFPTVLSLDLSKYN